MAEFIRARFKAPGSLKLSEPMLLELAVTPTEQAQGLMGRRSLPWNHGMLFTFATPGMHGFWMKETFIPLDIAWLSPAGIVIGVDTMQPGNLRMKHPPKPIRYAVEVNAGLLRQFNVRVGDQLLVFSGKS